MSSYYDLLGVPRLASDQEIRKAYRSKAKQLHPDVNDSKDAHNKFVMLHKAYQTLIDKNKRYFYDNRLNPTSDKQRNAYNRYARYYNNNFYTDWAQTQKQKAEYEAKIKHEEFLRNKKKFKSSILFYPTYLFINLAAIFCLFLGIGVLLVCGIITYRTHLIIAVFLSPFICGGVYFIKCTYDWYIESIKYFK